MRRKERGEGGGQNVKKECQQKTRQLGADESNTSQDLFESGCCKNPSQAVSGVVRVLMLVDMITRRLSGEVRVSRSEAMF